MILKNKKNFILFKGSFIFFTFFYTLGADLFAQSPMPIKLNTQSFGIEMDLVIKELNSRPIDPKSSLEIAQSLKTINTEFVGLEAETLLFISKSEFYRSILKNPFMPKSHNLEISSGLLEKINSTLSEEAKSLQLSQMSKWLWQMIMKDFASSRKDKLLDNYQSASRIDPELKARADYLRKKVNLLSPWIQLYSKAQVKSINNKMIDIIKLYLKRLSIKAYYFHHHVTRKKGDPLKQFFVIPEYLLVPELKSNNKDSVQNKDISPATGEELRNEASKDLKNLEKNSEEATKSKEIDKIVSPSSNPMKNDWRPKN